MKDSQLYARVVPKTANLVISRRCCAKYHKNMWQNARRTCSTILFCLLRPVYTVRLVGRFCRADKSYRVNCVKRVIFPPKISLPVVLLASAVSNALIFFSICGHYPNPYPLIDMAVSIWASARLQKICCSATYFLNRTDLWVAHRLLKYTQDVRSDTVGPIINRADKSYHVKRPLTNDIVVLWRSRSRPCRRS